MTRQPHGLRQWLILLFLPLVLAPTGCLSCLNPVQKPPPEQTMCCGEIPAPCRSHVYVFFVHGVDPLDCANLRGLRDYVQSLGFTKTYYGQLYHTTYFAQEICRIHQEDADARFALVGFSFGANMVRDICHAVEPDGIHIDLLVYLGGNTLKNKPEDRPANSGHIVNILATGCIWNGDTLDDAENFNYTDVYHFGSPTHIRTLRLLAEELAEVAARVPQVERQLPPLEEEAPTPRPLRPETTTNEPGAGDFLKPRAAGTTAHGAQP